jgi:hypothetical protein
MIPIGEFFDIARADLPIIYALNASIETRIQICSGLLVPESASRPEQADCMVDHGYIVGASRHQWHPDVVKKRWITTGKLTCEHHTNPAPNQATPCDLETAMLPSDYLT